MKTMVLFGLLLLNVSMLCAQVLPPILVVKEQGKSRRLSVAKLDVECKIYGFLAETRMTMTFSNPTHRILEGELYFPLPEGSTISGYALDINGKMVDGVVVEKAKGRQVFESVVRRRIDPGLVEWTKGNNFKTRVYPIPANGSRTIRVEYVSQLNVQNGDRLYTLPLNFKEKISDFSLKVEVIKALNQPTVNKGAIANFAFRSWRDSYIAETRQKNAALNDDLIITVPQGLKQAVLVEQATDNQVYFAIQDSPQQLEIGRKAIIPRTITILWDASGSRADKDHQRELALLQDYFAQCRRQAITVNLLVIRNTTEQAKTFTIHDGNAEALMNYLKSIPYDGGTDLGSVIDRLPKQQPDFYLLFTDGISNFGKHAGIDFSKPVYVFSDSTIANYSFMKGIAASSGGQFFNINRLKTADVITKIGQPAFTFINATFDNNAIVDVTPQFRKPVHKTFVVSGKLLADKATITINYGVSGKVLQSKTFHLNRNKIIKGSLLKTFWALQELDDLMLFPEKNKQLITSLGKLFGLVTPGTSLIVLDSLDQYLEHRIRPPESMPELCKQYDKQIQFTKQRTEKEKQYKIEQVVQLWKRRKAWWNKTFDLSKKVLLKPSRKSRTTNGAAFFSLGAPRAARESADSDAAEEVPTVTMTVDMEAAPLERVADSATRLVSARRLVGGRAKKQDADSSISPTSGAVIKSWDPKTPYLDKLKAAKPDQQYTAYVKEKKHFAASPGFYLDCADFFMGQKNTPLAIRIVSNLAEMETENASLLRVMAQRLAEYGAIKPAIAAYGTVKEMRPEEPQSWRDLALSLAAEADQLYAQAQKTSRPDREALLKQARENYRQAIELMNHILITQWPRFAEIELIVLMELNRIIPKAKVAGLREIPIDPRLIQLLDLDLRIVISWDTDNTDIDLWVIEPTGEKAFYSNPNTHIGGHVSRDFTQGYGPEEYILKKAMSGSYAIKTNFYGSSATKILGAVTLKVDIFTNFGRPNEKHKTATVQLKENQGNGVVHVVDVKFADKD